jgi:glycosyltransferase involved in cell wall biosynthesis
LLAPSRSRLLGIAKDVLAHLLHFLLIQVPLICSIMRLLRKRRISLVVLNNDLHYHVAGALAAKFAGVPCICRKAGGIGEGKWIKKFLTPLVGLFVCISQATEKDQRENNPRSKCITTVYEGVDLVRFDRNRKRPASPENLQLPPGRKVVGLVSRFEPGKGHLEMLEAAAVVVKKYPNVVFLIVGGGHSAKARAIESKVRDTVHRLHLDDFVILTGWREDIPDLLGTMDMLVHCPTTWIEGLGMANLEAMAMGKPTIVSRNGGLPDAVVDGVTGFVVPPGDVPELARAILRLLEDAETARSFGRNARKRVETHFDMAINARKLEVLFAKYAAAIHEK